jgi:hypothetical protein
MVARWWNGNSVPPVTATPVIVRERTGVRISCATDGASVGYRIFKPGKTNDTVQRRVSTYDMAFVSGRVRQGAMVDAPVPWELYSGKPLRLSKGDSLVVRAQRIGYAFAETTYVMPQ